MRRPSPLPPELCDRAFGVAEALALGVEIGRLDRADLTRLFKGARIPADSVEENAIVRRSRALSPLLLPGQYFSHTTAAVLLGLRMPRRFEEEVLHVTSTGGRRAPRRTGVVGHRSACPPAGAPTSTQHPPAAGPTGTQLPATGAHRLPVSHPVETWLHCAELLTTRDLVVMGDGLVARRDPIASVEDLARAIDEHPRLSGAVRLRGALASIRPRTDSAMETLLRLAVVGAGLPEPIVNLPILDARGRAFAYADLAWEPERVILEYDGDHHRTDRAQYSVDIARTGRLQQLGWLVIRVDAALFSNPTPLLHHLTTALPTRRAALR